MYAPRPAECDRLEPVVDRRWIPPGHAGIEATVDVMVGIARDGARSRRVRELAAELEGVARGNPLDTAREIRAFLAARVRFEFDPPGLELIREPELLLRTVACHGFAWGDCDDVACLGAALGLAAGLPARYVLLAFHDSEPFEHVYAELETPSGWVELDTTRPAQFPPGLEIRRTATRGV